MTLSRIAFACVAAWLALPAAAGLPDWVKAIAERAPAIGEDLPRFSSRVLLREDRIEVEPDGSWRIRRRLATQVLTRGAAELAVGHFPFDDRREMLSSRGWHLPETGKAKKARGKPLDVSLSDAFLTDSRTRFVRVEGVDRGSLVFFEFEARERPYVLVYQTMFGGDTPSRVERLEVSTPEGWQLRHAWLRGPGPEPRVEGTRRTWELRDLGVEEAEPLGESPADRMPLLVVAVVPPPDADVEPAVFENWVDLAAWYEALARDRDAVTPDIAAAAARLSSDVEDDFFARVARTATFVRDRVRYLARAIGIGGYRPNPAREVLANLYGDCKDKGTLLQALLAAGGVESFPVLVHATLADTVAESVPSIEAFDHLVVGVPVPDSIPVPPEYAVAVVEAGPLGRLLLVDATDEFTAVGAMPSHLVGKTVLVVAGERSDLIAIPDAVSAAHRIERRVEVEVGAEDELAVRLVSRRLGAPAAEARQLHRASSIEFRTAMERALRERWPGAGIDELEVVEDAGDGAFEVRARVTISGFADELLAVFPGATEDLPRVSLTRRVSPVRYPYALTSSYETTIQGVPATVATPADDEREGDGWKVSVRYRRNGATLHGIWRLTLERRSFDPASFEGLRRLWGSMRRLAAGAVAFR